MAKKVDTDDPSKAPNGPHPEVVKAIIKTIESEREGMLSLKMTYVQNCKPFHERINAAFEKARGVGMKKKALREILRKRELERKLETVGSDLEDEDLDSFEAIEQALGALNDTPLGEAAKARHRPSANDDKKPEQAGKPARRRGPPSPKHTASEDEDDRDLRPDHLRSADAQRVAEENASKIEAGISQLN